MLRESYHHHRREELSLGIPKIVTSEPGLVRDRLGRDA